MRRSSLISLTLAAWVSLAAGAFAQVAPERAPQRVVSMNLCTDQFAMLVAAPSQLISVSAIASDPLVSPMAEEAATYPINYGAAEQIFLLQPDLVVAGVWSNPAVISMLRRLGIRVELFELEDSLSDIAPQLARMGELLGRQTEAQALISQFEADLEDLTGAPNGPRTAFYSANGYTSGTNSMAHEVVTTAGFTHIADELQRSASGHLALEVLVLAAPDLIISSQLYPGSSRSEEILRHPALLALVAAGNGYDSGPEWVCGTPAVLDALRDLGALRAEMSQ